MRVLFETSLNKAQDYIRQLNTEWDSVVPSVGHYILFNANEHGIFRLKVVAITWEKSGLIAYVRLGVPEEFIHDLDWELWYEKNIEE